MLSAITFASMVIGVLFLVRFLAADVIVYLSFGTYTCGRQVQGYADVRCRSYVRLGLSDILLIETLF